MKNLLTLAFSIFVKLLFAQNDSLTYKEAYDFVVGDTFQSVVYTHTTGAPPNLQRNYKTRQTVVKEKIDFFSSNQNKYLLQTEEFGFQYTKPNVLTPFYRNNVGIAYYNASGTKIKTEHTCTNIPNPTPNLFCYDSIVSDYGSRKTLKHEYNAQNAQRISEYYVQGLGLALKQKSGEDPYFFYDDKMIYFNKNGEKWGTSMVNFGQIRANFKQLTNREAYDFEVGDVFIYASTFYNIAQNKLDSNYEKRIILSKNSSINKDSIVYIYQKIYTTKHISDRIFSKIDTLVVKDLDSIAVYKVKPNTNINSYKEYISDSYYTLSWTDRNVSGRYLNCDCVDAAYGFYVGKGIGMTYQYSNYPYETRLIYFKKGNETWGVPVILNTIETPSVKNVKMTISPNPVSDILTIDADVFFNKIQIFNLNGQVVLQQQKLNTVQVSQLANGMYFVQIFEDNILKGVDKFTVFHK